MPATPEQLQALINEAVLRDVGTAGSIPYLDSNLKLAQVNTDLFYDAVHSRLGVGTASPTDKFHAANSLGTTVAGHFSQSTVTAPVLKLSGSALAGILTQTLVAGASVTTATKALFARVRVEDANEVVTAGDYYIELFTIT